MKVYTRKGDKGKTGLIGGTRVAKYDLRIEAYGTVDELNSYLGLLRDKVTDTHLQEELIAVQDRLFTIGSWLATDPEKSAMQLPEILESDITHLENEMDEMDKELEPMRFFVLPGGHETVSVCHIARCVCRRAERLTAQLHDRAPVNPLILPYLNRLSDYLFVCSRWLSEKLGAQETPWKPKK